jgi:hypothetical protein
MTFFSIELFFNAPIEEERNMCIFFSFFPRIVSVYFRQVFLGLTSDMTLFKALITEPFCEYIVHLLWWKSDFKRKPDLVSGHGRYFLHSHQ